MFACTTRLALHLNVIKHYAYFVCNVPVDLKREGSTISVVWAAISADRPEFTSGKRMEIARLTKLAAIRRTSIYRRCELRAVRKVGLVPLHTHLHFTARLLYDIRAECIQRSSHRPNIILHIT